MQRQVIFSIFPSVRFSFGDISGSLSHPSDQHYFTEFLRAHISSILKVFCFFKIFLFAYLNSLFQEWRESAFPIKKSVFPT